MKKFFLVSYLSCLLLTNVFGSVQVALAQGFLGFSEPNECKIKDRDGKASILPVLVICGRSPASGACSAYTNPCTLGDLVETGRRVLIFIIMIVLMVLPLIIAYYGAQMILYRQMPNFGGAGDINKLKDKILWLVIYFVCLLAAWIIVRTIVDITQVDPRINTFLIENGQQVKARQFDFSR